MQRRKNRARNVESCKAYILYSLSAGVYYIFEKGEGVADASCDLAVYFRGHFCTSALERSRERERETSL